MSLTIKQEIEMNDLYNMLWGGAKSKWDSATDKQRAYVWSLLIDIFQYNEDKIPDITTINDFIWFDCEDIFDENEDTLVINK